jgi:vacuolar protein sorting-associated protein 13A/C
LEQPLHDIYVFLLKLAKLKGLYDAASQVAVQRASEIERMQFEISIKSPIVVFPSDAERSKDTLVLRLGEVSARNASEPSVNRVTASLTGVQFVSNQNISGVLSSLKIIDDIKVTANVVQRIGIDRDQDQGVPDTQVRASISLADI